MRIIVTGGGTGGHVFPALEIVSELKRHHIEVVFVGNTQSFEEKMAIAKNVEFFGLSAKKLVGQSFFRKLLAVIYLKLAVLRSLFFLLKRRPSAIIGVGGYVSAPMMIAGFLLGIKRYVCEQNVVPGFANKLLGKIATRVFISFDDSRAYFPKEKTILTGNPVRSDFFLVPQKGGALNKILITGGSLGANYLNDQIPQVLRLIQSECPDLTITHQTGPSTRTQVSDLYQPVNLTTKVVSFIENMPQEFAQHDLIISRAGATICAEIMASGMPAILIPYPFANAHQKYNAYALSKLDAAIMIEEGPRFKDELASVLKDLYNNPKRLQKMAEKARSLACKHAASTIVNHVLQDR